MTNENDETDDVDEANQPDGVDEVSQPDQIDEVALNVLLAAGVSPLVALAGSVKKGRGRRGGPDPAKEPSAWQIALMVIFGLALFWLLTRLG